MHLLNVETLCIETFHDAEAPDYAILSHTWGREEVTFVDIQDLSSPRVASLVGFEKIRKTCERATIDGHHYVWIDTCCIDKSSSAELSEAINSMFRWYREASICYAYLSDVTQADFEESFPGSRWFRRGWTLQELLSPDHVVFYDRDWHDLGTKTDHADWISDITGIDLEALFPGGSHEDFTEATLNRFCIAKRMSWAAKRETTRVEDIAYCLLGIFNINMPLLYGEREYAFIRLQEELIKKYDDDSILAWGLDPTALDPLSIVPREVAYSICGGDSPSSILASSPKEFEHCHSLQYAGISSIRSFELNNAGFQIEIPLIPVYPPQPYYNNQAPDEIQGWIGLLGCSTGDGSQFLGIVLVPEGLQRDSPAEVTRVRFSNPCDKHTLRVGPRAAMQAEQKQVTIVQQNECRTIRNYSFGYRNFIVNESEALLDAGYECSYATAKKMVRYGWAFDYRPEWNTLAKVLTIAGAFVDSDLLRFEFTGPDPSSDFTVLVRGSNSMVRDGVSFSDAEEEDLHRQLGLVNTTTRSSTLQDHDGADQLITIAIRQNVVFSSKITEIHVDLTPSTAEES